jgi:hypothetical protein
MLTFEDGYLNIIFNIHCKKRLVIFPSPAGMSLTNFSLAGKFKFGLVRDIPAGDGKIDKLFYSAHCIVIYLQSEEHAVRGIRAHNALPLPPFSKGRTQMEGEGGRQ